MAITWDRRQCVLKSECAIIGHGGGSWRRYHWVIARGLLNNGLTLMERQASDPIRRNLADILTIINKSDMQNQQQKQSAVRWNQMNNK
jgi:hypothetical protein